MAEIDPNQEVENWSRTGKVSEDGSLLTLTESRSLLIPINEVPANTLGRLQRMRLPTIPQVLIAALGSAAVVDSIIRVFPKTYPAPSELIEFFAGISLAAVATFRWADRVDLASTGIEELRDQLVLSRNTSLSEDL